MKATKVHRAVIINWTLVCLLSVNLVWTTLCLGGYRPETMLVTSLLTVLTLMVHLISRVWSEVEARLHPVGWIFVPFLIYAAANVIWVTPVPWLGWHDWMLWANLFVTFWVVLNGVNLISAQKDLLLVIGCLALVATVLAAYQHFVEPEWMMLGRLQSLQFLSRSSGPFGIPNSLAAFFILITPAIWVLAVRRTATALQRVFFGYLGICCVFSLLLTVSRGGWAALALALMIWPLFAMRRSWWVRLSAVVGVGSVIVLVGMLLFTLSPIVRDRYHAMINESGEWTRPVMWRGAWELFRSNPATGSGAGSYNILFEKHRPVLYQMEPQWAHNDYLNTLSDYGVVGFVFSFGAVASVVLIGLRRRRISQSPPGKHQAMDEPLFWQAIAVGMLAFAAQLFVDFHFKIPALGMLFAILSALLVQRVWPIGLHNISAPNKVQRPVVILAVLGLGWGGIAGIYPFYRSESLRYSARQALDTLWQHEISEDIYRATLISADVSLRRATKINVKNAQAWADLSLVNALWGHLEPKNAAKFGQEAAEYASRALAISEVVPEFWIRRSVGNDMQGNWLDAGGDMIKAMLLAPANSSVWFYQGFHLSLKRSTMPQALAALDYCLRLDPGNFTAKRLCQQLALDSKALNP